MQSEATAPLFIPVRTLAALGLALALAGCASGVPRTDAHPTSVPSLGSINLPAQWYAPMQTLAHGGKTQQLSLWWAALNDTALVDLMAAAQQMSDHGEGVNRTRDEKRCRAGVAAEQNIELFDDLIRVFVMVNHHRASIGPCERIPKPHGAFAIASIRRIRQ